VSLVIRLQERAAFGYSFIKFAKNEPETLICFCLDFAVGGL